MRQGTYQLRLVNNDEILDTRRVPEPGRVWFSGLFGRGTWTCR